MVAVTWLPMPERTGGLREAFAVAAERGRVDKTSN